MFTLTIAMQDIIVDLKGETDLLSLPQDQAVALIRQCYAFLSPSVQVTIKGNNATITADDIDSRETGQVEQAYNQAGKNARAGRYANAMRQLESVLRLMPTHTDARQDLAMVHYELGDFDKAETCLVEVLRLDPQDSGSYLILGNIYAKHKRDLAEAERFYRRAFDINPDDPYLLNSYGALLAAQEKYDQAREFFQRAIDINPSHPNPHLGIALAYLQEGRPEPALEKLEGFFAEARSTDVRSVPVYQEARKLYLEANRRTAENAYHQLEDFIQERREALEKQTGFPIELIQDDSLNVTARTQIAWAHHRDRHIVRYKNRPPSIRTHLLAHEFEHITLEHEARRAGRQRIFMMGKQIQDYALRLLSDHVTKMKKQGYPDQVVNQFMAEIINGLAIQLLNIPLDMIIEYRLFQQYPVLRPSQFASLYEMYHEGLVAVTDDKVKKVTPSFVLRANAILNCAYALFIDHLYPGKTDYAAPYQALGFIAKGQQLFDLWQQAMSDFEPGDEYDLVDEAAQVLKLTKWYEWHTVYEWELDQEATHPEGPTNPELLKQKEPATVMYCLDALQRFSSMSDEEVNAIATEIAWVGRDGIDYASAESKYTLRSLAGKNFTGLQLLCLMYVGYQRINPTLDTGLPFHDAYEIALQMYQAKG